MLELGAGQGLVGLACALAGAERVTLTGAVHAPADQRCAKRGVRAPADRNTHARAFFISRNLARTHTCSFAL